MTNDHQAEADSSGHQNQLSPYGLEAVIDLAGLGVWQMDIVTGQVHCNETCQKLLRLPQRPVFSIPEWLHLFSAADQDRLLQALASLTDGVKEKVQISLSGFSFTCTLIEEVSGAYSIYGLVSPGKAALKGPLLNGYLTQHTTPGISRKDVQVGLFHIQLKDNILEYTPSFATILTGKPVTGYCRQDFIRHIHPEDASARTQAYEQAAKTGDLYYEGRTIWLDGSIHWIRTTGAYSFDKDGTPLFLTGTLQDITAEKARASELYETEMRFRSIIQEAPMGIALLAGRDMIVEVGNEKIFELWGKDNSLLGRPLLEILPEIKGQGFMELLAHVYDTGQPYFGAATNVSLKRNGRLETCYFDFTYAPSLGQDGKVSGVMVLANEVTEQVTARKKIEESQLQFLTLIKEAPFATALYKGSDLVIEIANNAMIELWDKDEGVIGKRLADAVPELKGQPFLPLLTRVFETGESHHEQEAPADLMIHGKLSTFYFNYTYKPMLDEQGKVYAILNMAVDVTEQVQARRKLEESELFARSIIYNSPVAKLVVTGPDLMVSIANENLLAILGKDAGIIGQPLATAVPELDATLADKLRQVLHTGRTISAIEEAIKINKHGREETGYYNTILKPLPSAEGGYYGVILTVVDVTGQVLARRKLEESELFAHSIIYNSPVAKLVLTGPEQKVSIANENLLQIFDKDNAILDHPLQEAMPELWAALHERLDLVLHTGQTFTTEEEAYRITRAGATETRYFNSICKPLPSAAGGNYGVIVTIVDVTEQVRSRQRMAEAKEALRGAIELAELGTWEMDLQKKVLYYSDRLSEWAGVPPGLPVPESESLKPVHPEDREEVAQAIAAACIPGNSGFNTEYRLVHPQTGDVRIIHAQGITYFDLKGTPVKMTGTARNVSKERQVQAALELEVKKRTAELNLLNKRLTDAVSELASANEQLQRSNEDLAQYAHVASHDLQEPLRKIRMFSGMLKDRSGALPANDSLVAKINQSAERMSLLIKDLLDYSRLLKTEELKKPVDLNEVLREVLVDFELKIQEQKARIEVGTMPVMEAVPLQMNQLFFNLIGNALKFSVPDRAPVIRLNATAMSPHEVNNYLPFAKPHQHYYHITISDNGIGFEDKYAQQIFEVFKRLHGRDVYPGSGIGLALCRRIVDNHRGHIFATSQPGAGTTFHLILPEKQP